MKATCAEGVLIDWRKLYRMYLIAERVTMNWIKYKRFSFGRSEENLLFREDLHISSRSQKEKFIILSNSLFNQDTRYIIQRIFLPNFNMIGSRIRQPQAQLHKFMDCWIGKIWTPSIRIWFLIISWWLFIAETHHQIDEFGKQHVFFQDGRAFIHERWLLYLHLWRFLLVLFVDELGLLRLLALLLEGVSLSLVLSEEVRGLRLPSASVHLHPEWLLGNGFFIHHPIHSPDPWEELLLHKTLIIVPLGDEFMIPTIKIIKLYQLIQLLSFPITFTVTLA